MIDIKQVVALQTDMVNRWHIGPVINRLEGTLGIVCEQHRWNFLLWHEEDIARSPVASDREIAEVKRAIDRYNQQRNDWIERLDDHITEQCSAQYGNTGQRDRPTLDHEPANLPLG